MHEARRVSMVEQCDALIGSVGMADTLTEFIVQKLHDNKVIVS